MTPTPSLPRASPDAPPSGDGIRRRRRSATVGLGSLVVVGLLASLATGATSVSWTTVIEAFVAFDPRNTDHLIVRELRLPRTLLAVLVGAALGAAGALMQGVTRNPLADPGLLGVNAGAAFAVVVSIWSFGVTSLTGQVWFALGGAAVAAVAVYALASSGAGATPVRLALAGAAMSALLFSLTRGVTLLDEATLDEFRFWAVGSLSGADAGAVRQAVGFVAVGLVLAVAVARPLNTVALGDATASALGTRVGTVRAVSLLATTLLCGTAVAVAGPIAFVGLVVPHAVRLWCGTDQRWVVPLSAVAGTVLILFGDTLGRVVVGPGELQVGIVTALVGGPVFVTLVRRSRMASL